MGGKQKSAPSFFSSFTNFLHNAGTMQVYTFPTPGSLNNIRYCHDIRCSIGCVHRSGQVPHISFEKCDDTTQYQVGADVSNPVVPLPMDFEFDPPASPVVCDGDFGVGAFDVTDDDEWAEIDNLLQDGVKNNDFSDFFPEILEEKTAFELPFSPCDVLCDDFVCDNEEEKDFFLSLF